MPSVEKVTSEFDVRLMAIPGLFYHQAIRGPNFLLFPEKEAKSVVPLRGRAIRAQFCKLTLGHAPQKALGRTSYTGV
jgi:hypothetical protein